LRVSDLPQLLTEALTETRERTLRLVAGLDAATLETVYSTLLSPLVWDLAHIACFEDLWISRAAGVPALAPELFTIYDAIETPRSRRGELELLGTEESFAHMAAVRARTEALIGQVARDRSDLIELVICHEQQHNETMLQLLALARLPNPFHQTHAPDSLAGGSGGAAPTRGALELVDFAGGEVTIGAGPERGFVYDNERPAHVRALAPFRLALTPATNADWLEFMDAGGYRRDELWSPEGWRWCQEEQIERPLHWTEDGRLWRLGELVDIDPEVPVMHISWFEADAFATFHGLRLPSEYEWELAATLDPASGLQRPMPWGSEPVSRAWANLDQVSGGPLAPASFDGATRGGLRSMIGDVWEWTSSWFEGYPGFAAYPYHEYSAPFFGERYRVLRGGSWATRPRVASTTFRNWDLPQRRQIFAGVRLAGDA
jgi:iron(II)-dependent oxidoreductase